MGYGLTNYGDQLYTAARYYRRAVALQHYI